MKLKIIEIAGVLEFEIADFRIFPPLENAKHLLILNSVFS